MSRKYLVPQDRAHRKPSINTIIIYLYPLILRTVSSTWWVFNKCLLKEEKLICMTNHFTCFFLKYINISQNENIFLDCSLHFFNTGDLYKREMYHFIFWTAQVFYFLPTNNELLCNNALLSILSKRLLKKCFP